MSHRRRVIGRSPVARRTRLAGHLLPAGRDWPAPAALKRLLREERVHRSDIAITRIRESDEREVFFSAVAKDRVLVGDRATPEIHARRRTDLEGDSIRERGPFLRIVIGKEFPFLDNNKKD